nr:MAG TPA: hypothetical protein [Caudoviricetes sp.]
MLQQELSILLVVLMTDKIHIALPLRMIKLMMHTS